MSLRTIRYIYICVVTPLLFLLFLNYNFLSYYSIFLFLSIIYIGQKVLSGLYKEGIFSLAVVFNIFGFLYTHYYMLELLFYNSKISENNYIAMGLSTIAIISFNFAYSHTTIKATNKRYDITYQKLNINKFTFFLVLFFLISLLAEYYVIFVKIGISNYLGVSRSEQALLRSDLSIFTFYTHTIPIISSISLYLYIKYRGKIRLLLFLVSFIVSLIGAIITASRAEILSIILPIIFILKYFNIISNKTTILVCFSAFILFGIWKSLYSESLEIQYDSEFVSWYKIVDTIISDSNAPVLLGESYLNTLINLVIPVTGTEPLSVWYVRTYLPDVYAAGGGRGFSSVLEAYMNFHVLGIVLLYALYGNLAKKLQPDTPIKIMLYMMVLVSINMLFRSESYAFWKNMMWFKVYPITLFYYLSLKRFKRT